MIKFWVAYVINIAKLKHDTNKSIHGYKFTKQETSNQTPGKIQRKVEETQHRFHETKITKNAAN